MTSTLDGMDAHRRATTRTFLVQHAALDVTPDTSPQVATGTSAIPSSPPRRLAWRPRVAGTSLVGLTAAALAVTTVVVVSRPLPAYAVTGGNGKEVHIEVNRLEGAEALEDALAERGITAEITYLPGGQQCQPERYPDIPTPGLTLGVSADRFQVTIPAGAVSDDETFVLSAAVTPIDHGVQAVVDFGITEGPIAPCVAMDPT